MMVARWDVIQDDALNHLYRHIMVSDLHVKDRAKVGKLVDEAEVEEEMWPI